MIWYAHLLGLPWKLGGDDPATGIDCWRLVELGAEALGLPAPPRIAPDARERLGSPDADADMRVRLERVRQDLHAPGDILAMSSLGCGYTSHVALVATKTLALHVTMAHPVHATEIWRLPGVTACWRIRR